MKTIETEILINASVNQVWNTLMDFPSHSKWNPFIRVIKGNPEVGKRIEVEIHLPKKSPMNFTPVVVTNHRNMEFRWRGKLGIKGLFDGEHYFKLKAISSTQTKLIHGENFYGLLVPIIFGMIKTDTIKGFESMNTALQLHLD